MEGNVEDRKPRCNLWTFHNILQSISIAAIGRSADAGWPA